MKWNILKKPINTDKTAADNGISPICAAVLLNRGFSDKKTIEEFLNTSSKNLPDAFLINDFEKALAILSDALDRKEKIYIYGDYDADGVMSTVILYRGLKTLGADVHFYVPHRVHDGYGLNPAAVEKIHDEGCKLLVTCDNGIASLNEIRLAKELGMRTVILDHHEPVVENDAQKLPCADAVVDCKRHDNTYPFREMCAGGLCYRFIKEFYKYINRPFRLDRELVTFAGIATVCDMVPLVSDNRILAKNAIYLLNHDIRNPGLSALVTLLEKPGTTIGDYEIGFHIGPSINAIGRLEAASEAVKLFISEDKDEISEYSKLLYNKNNERKQITRSAEERITKTVDDSMPVLVLYDPDTHESVAGLIAGHIKEKFCRPTLVITKGEEGCKGSGRSVEGYDMYKNLSAFRELFTKFGGHTMAVGFSLPYENIDKLRTALNEACPLKISDMEPSIRLEYEIPLDLVTLGLIRELSILEPFGMKNERPLFYTLGANISSIRFVGADKNIPQLTFSASSNKQIRSVFFGGAEKIKHLLEQNMKADYIKPLENGNTLRINLSADIAYTLNINTYNGVDYPQLNIIDIKNNGAQF